MKRWTLLIALAFTLAAGGFASACPMCKDSIPNSETGEAAQTGGLPGGFNKSIYIMLGGLFVTLGLLTLGVVKEIRNTDVRMNQTGTSTGDTTTGQSSRGFEVRPSDSSQGGTE